MEVLETLCVFIPYACVSDAASYSPYSKKEICRIRILWIDLLGYFPSFHLRINSEVLMQLRNI